jgi:type IV pilus assembly protein PilE
MRAGTRRESGLTLLEVLTGVVALVVIVAVAIPMWRTHQLKVRRGEAIDALLAVQAAQDRYFGAHASYADASKMPVAPPEGLGVRSASERNSYSIHIERSADGLGYMAIARATGVGAASKDPRCADMRLDHHGRRSAFNSDGEDSSADCWNQM